MASKFKQFSTTLGTILSENLDDSSSAPQITQKRVSQNILAASAGKRKQVSVLSVSPKRCKLWNLHNRNQKYLTEETCKDLIENIKLNDQIEPALAREISGDPDYDFEIIYGSRRRYACSFLGRDLQIVITTASDQECAILMDAENRARKDISDYERAADYKKWLETGLYSTQKDLAKSIGMDTSNFAKFMKIVELPQFVIEAFKSPLDIKIHYAPELLKILENEAHAKRLQGIANDVKSKNLEGSFVYKALLSAASEQINKVNKPSEVIKSENGKTLFVIKMKKENCFEIKLTKNLDQEHMGKVKTKLLSIIDKYVSVS